MPDACLVLKEGLTGGGSSAFISSPSRLSFPGPEPAYLGMGMEALREPKMLWRFRGVESAVRLGEAEGLPFLPVNNQDPESQSGGHLFHLIKVQALFPFLQSQTCEKNKAPHTQPLRDDFQPSSHMDLELLSLR